MFPIRDENPIVRAPIAVIALVGLNIASWVFVQGLGTHAAVAMLGYWFLIQILGGLPALAGASSGVAFWAHVGGFLAGVILVGPFHQQAYLEAHRRQVPRQLARRRNTDRDSRS